MFSIEIGILKISGKDSKKFLNAIISNDIEGLMPNNSLPSLLLEPSGHIVSAFIVYCVEVNNYLIICEKDLVEKTQNGLQRFLIRTDASIENISENYSGCILNSSEEFSGIVIEQNYCGSNIYSFGIVDKELENNDEHINELIRISFGAIKVSKDFDDKVIPQEANLDKRCVSFRKGCYLGQELVCRIDSREASTPFKYFALKTENEIKGDEAVFVDEVSQGKVVSCVDTQELRNEINLGPYNSILKISRKAKDYLNHGGKIVISKNEIGIDQIYEINGYFSY